MNARGEEAEPGLQLGWQSPWRLAGPLVVGPFSCLTSQHARPAPASPTAGLTQVLSCHLFLSLSLSPHCRPLICP